MAKKRLGQITLAVVISVLALVSFAYFLGGSRAALAQTTQPDQTNQRTITVSGQGQVQVQPDMAMVTLGVETEADTAADALSQNSEQMQQVISTTVDAGIEEADIQTQGINLFPVYSQGTDTSSPTLTGFRARNVVQITARDLDNLGALLDDIVSAGGNSIDGIQFEVSNRDAVESDARTAAMENAREKATQLAELADAELGQVLTLNETGFSTPAPFTTARVADEAAASVPVQAGTQSINYTINVTWELQ